MKKAAFVFVAAALAFGVTESRPPFPGDWEDGDDPAQVLAYLLGDDVAFDDVAVQENANFLDEAITEESNDVDYGVASVEGCIRYLYVFGFTGIVPEADSTGPFVIEAWAYNQRRQAVLSPSDYQHGDGNLWKIPFDDFGFPRCVRKLDLRALAVVACVSDGWFVDSIVTFIASAGGKRFELLTQDIEVDRWVDTDRGSRYTRLRLTRV